MKGIFTHRKTIRSLNNIYIPSHISKIKNTKLIYPSILKYFSALSLHARCIKLHSILPPSSAGIGKILKIAKASEIIHANHKYAIQSCSCISLSQNFIAPAGHANLFTDSLILLPLNDNKSFHNFHKAFNVRLVSAFISCNHITIALFNGALISLISIFHDDIIDIHNKH
jgi:hypothetical protein